MPMRVLGPLPLFSTCSMSCPPRETCSCVPSAALAVEMTLLMASFGVCPTWPSKVTVAYAMVPSLLTCLLPAAVNGLVTDRTCGSFATLASIALAGCSTALSVTAPDLAARTIWSELPDAAGKSFCSRSIAVAVSVCGSVNFVEKAVPAAWLATAVRIRAASQNASTAQRCVKHQRPRAFTGDRRRRRRARSRRARDLLGGASGARTYGSGWGAARTVRRSRAVTVGRRRRGGAARRAGGASASPASSRSRPSSTMADSVRRSPARDRSMAERITAPPRAASRRG